MQTLLQSRLQAIDSAKLQQTLTGMRRGIEKESLRIDPNGHLAQTPHPKALGSALTHESITTDYSEALLEFITPAFEAIDQPLEYLDKLHRFTYQQLENEKLWVNSMPCIMDGELSIPIAEYGSSNIGKMKTIYRHGLWHRYGRLMQTIAGIHYNVSFPENFWQGLQRIDGNDAPLQDYISDQYFRLIRNFQRYVGLVIYLYGASPAVCPTFLRGRQHNLEWLNEKQNTLYTPYGTSLRMSDLGYHNDAQAGLKVSYNSLQEYIQNLSHAMRTPHQAYVDLGVKKDDQYQQLNANILQIENEYYGSIRPKRTIQRGERPTTALAKRGVEYIEMRCVDLDPYLPIGIGKRQMRFLETFALFCLLEDSPEISDQELECINFNREAIVLNGRNPELKLHCGSNEVGFHEWASSVVGKIQTVAKLLDEAHGTDLYTKAVESQQEKISSPEKTRSAKIIQQIRNEDTSFYQFAMQQAKQHEAYFLEKPLDAADLEMLKTAANQSLADQTQIEESDDKTFEQFLSDYFR